MPKKRKIELQTTQQTFDAWEWYQERGSVPAKIPHIEDDDLEEVMVLQVKTAKKEWQSFVEKNGERELRATEGI